MYQVCRYLPYTDSFGPWIESFRNYEDAIEYANMLAGTLTDGNKFSNFEPYPMAIFDDNHDSPRWTNF